MPKPSDEGKIPLSSLARRKIVFNYRTPQSPKFSPLDVHGKRYLRNQDEVVIPEGSIRINFDYPLDKGHVFEINSPAGKGFTRGDLWEEIARRYQKIYLEEYQSSYLKPTHFTKRRGILNRETTFGTYGIWGHDIHDLSLEEMIYSPTKECWELELASA